VNRAVTAGWLVLAVVVLRLLLRRAPRWIHCTLWGVVAARLALPFSIPSSFSLVPSAQTIVPGSLHAARPVIETGIPAVNTQVEQYLQSVYYEGVTVPAGTAAHTADLLAVIWITGAALLGLYCLGTYLHLRFRLRTAVRSPDGLWQSEWVDSPFVLGLLRPRIYVPFRMDGDTLAQVAAHERAHIARGDHVWKVLAFVLLALHWFQPLLWAAYILFCRDMEYACDQRVLRALDDEGRRRYSAALLHCAAPRRTAAVCPVAFGELRVGQRIKGALHYKKPAFWLVLLAVLALVVTAVCFLTDPPVKDGPHWLRTRTSWRLSDAELLVYYSGSGGAAYYARALDQQQQRTLSALLRQLDTDQLTEGGFRIEAPEGCSLYFPEGIYLSLPEGSEDQVELSYEGQLTLIRSRELADCLRAVLPAEALTWHQPRYGNDKMPPFLMLAPELGCDAVDISYFSGTLNRGTPPLTQMDTTNGSGSTVAGRAAVLSGSRIIWTPPAWDSATPRRSAVTFTLYLQGGERDGQSLEIDVQGTPTYWGETQNGMDYHIVVLHNSFPLTAALDGNTLLLRDETYAGGEYPENMRHEGHYYEDGYDVLRFDVDGDGVTETCSLGFGPTSGLFTFTMAARVDGQIKYVGIFHSDWYDLRFTEQHGHPQVLGVTQTGAEHFFDIAVRNGQLVLSEDGEELNSISSLTEQDARSALTGSEWELP